MTIKIQISFFYSKNEWPAPLFAPNFKLVNVHSNLYKACIIPYEFLAYLSPRFLGLDHYAPLGWHLDSPVPASRSPLCRVLVGHLVHISSSRFLKP